ncbi:rod-binding protein [Aurantimonas sp. A3-2-R12]|uniref:rod-binding protein n=1 Tax=Aurantimonas sp. A3-2-R12 TaxID=3114362 RepID=UPI002E16E8BD|nr:rod-binding protein [Aurantimonas sp. A3-2-R12]
MTVSPILSAAKTEPTQIAPRVTDSRMVKDAASTDFATILDAAAPDVTPAAPIIPLVAHEARAVPPLEQFEGFVLRSFVESMLPSEASSYFGSGTAGAIWRSMMAEEIGNELAKGGGIGIAASIANEPGGGFAAVDGREAASDSLNRMLRQNDIARAGAIRKDSAE